MRSVMHQVRVIFRRLWEVLKAAGTASMALVKSQYFKLRKLLRYMAGETRRHLPEWKEDAREYREEQHDRFTRFKRLVRLEWQEWRDSFGSLDASPGKLHEMLFEDRTKIGRRFEELLIVIIIGSVIVVLLDSVPEIHRKFGFLLGALEWIFTIIFTIEYLLRIYSSPHPIRYITSFYGVIDLITVIPTYIAIFFAGAHTFLILRVLRVFRVFRLLKLVKMMQAGQAIQTALDASKAKIAVFLIFVLLLVTLMGSVLYIVEAGAGSGFTSIPNSIYWAIITLTTVGYGDITPVTWFGKMIAAGIMLVGYAIIAVPTGIVSAELIRDTRKAIRVAIECVRCGLDDHASHARYCNRCGDRLGQISGGAPGVDAPV
jgi:voltage-gated potassium channel